MAHTRHRKKTLRKSRETRLENRSSRAAMRTAVKDAKEAVAENPADADAAMALAAKRIDKAGRKRLIHPNKAARIKSRLQKARNRASK